MAKAVEEARIKAQDTTNSMNYGFGGWYAKELYTAGYRKASEVAREIFAEIEEILIDNSYQISEEFYEFYDKRGVKKALDELKKKYTEDGE